MVYSSLHIWLPCVLTLYLFQNDFIQYEPHEERQKDPERERISTEYQALQVFQEKFHQRELALGQTFSLCFAIKKIIKDNN